MRRGGKRPMILLFIAVVVIVFVILGLRGKRTSAPVAPPSANTGEELAVLKEKIKNMEKYRMRERYTSPNENNGMTIAGTLLEQFLDISIEVFNQPLVKEMLDKIIKDTGDARVIASVIEDIGGTVKESIKKNNLLECLTKLDCTYETEQNENERAARNFYKCRVGDTDEFREVKRMDPLSDDAYKSSDTKNCHRYTPKQESFTNIMIDVRNKLGDMLTNPEKQKLYYDTFMQVGKNNIDFLEQNDIHVNAIMKQNGRPNPFDEDGEFTKLMPREHALGEMTNMGQAFKEAKPYILKPYNPPPSE